MAAKARRELAGDSQRHQGRSLAPLAGKPPVFAENGGIFPGRRRTLKAWNQTTIRKTAGETTPPATRVGICLP
jgi:hypothetical protein